MKSYTYCFWLDTVYLLLHVQRVNCNPINTFCRKFNFVGNCILYSAFNTLHCTTYIRRLGMKSSSIETVWLDCINYAWYTISIHLIRILLRMMWDHRFRRTHNIPQTFSFKWFVEIGSINFHIRIEIGQRSLYWCPLLPPGHV